MPTFPPPLTAALADRYDMERRLGADALGRPTSIDIIYPIGYII